MLKSENLQEAMEELQKPFDSKDIEWRVGNTNKDKSKGLVFAYVTNRAIQERLDEVFTSGGWKNEYISWGENSQLCGISVRVTYDDGRSEWITKWDGAENTEYEAIKGGLSAAMKRTAVQWGIGRYLYEIPTQWVLVEPRGKSYGIPKNELQKLNQYIENLRNDLVNSGYNQPQPQSQQKQQSAPQPQYQPQSNKDNKAGERIATEPQKRVLRKNAKKLNLTEEMIEMVSFSQASGLIGALYNKDTKSA